jgi:hypothetical protein
MLDRVGNETHRVPAIAHSPMKVAQSSSKEGCLIYVKVGHLRIDEL